MTGVIKKIIHIRGFGFIEDEQGVERFLLVYDLVDQQTWPQLKRGDHVEFEPTTRPKGFGVASVRRRES